MDVTTNPKYIAMKSSIDSDVQKAQIRKDLEDKANAAEGTANQSSADTQLRLFKANNPEAGGDPDAISHMGALSLAALTATLQAEDSATAKDNINAIRDQALGSNSDDIMLEALYVMGLIVSAVTTTAQGYLNEGKTNSENVQSLDKLSSAVRNSTPDGSDPTKTGIISGDTVDQLNALGVTFPASMNVVQGTASYTIKQADFDTILQNIQSRQTDFSTLNSQTQNSLSRCMDTLSSAETGQASIIEKKAQVDNKAANG